MYPEAWHRSVLKAAALLPLAASLGACGSGIALDEPIEGPVWRLAQMDGQPVAPGSDPARNPQLQFERGAGRVSGSGGCNRLAGSYTRSGSRLHLSPLGSTRMACADDGRNQLESRFLQRLQATTSYRLPAPGRMVLLDASGQTLAAFEAAR
ncbi:MAG: META domain-containing protein [Xenophilus sp.]